MRAKRILLTALLLCGGLNAVVVAAQGISTVDIQSIADGNMQVTVNGAAFGAKPNIVYYNDFRGDALYGSVSKTGQRAGVTSFGRVVPTIGVMEETRGFYAVDATDTPAILQAILDKAYEDVFVAYSVGIPETATAPMMLDPKTKVWFKGASWKMTWLLESSDAYATESEFDMCGPTLVYMNSSLSGNSSKFVDAVDGATHIHGNVTKWWAWDTLNHLEIILDGDLAAPDKTTGSFSVVNKDFKYVNFPHDAIGSVYKGPLPKIAQINFPGWFRGSTEDKFQALYSNIYISAGSGFLSRFELTDNKDYKQSTYRRVVLPTSWEPTKVTFTLYMHEYKRKGGLFVHYFNEKGELVSQGNVCSKCPEFGSSVKTL